MKRKRIKMVFAIANLLLNHFLLLPNYQFSCITAWMASKWGFFVCVFPIIVSLEAPNNLKYGHLMQRLWEVCLFALFIIYFILLFDHFAFKIVRCLIRSMAVVTPELNNSFHIYFFLFWIWKCKMRKLVGAKKKRPNSTTSSFRTHYYLLVFPFILNGSIVKCCLFALSFDSCGRVIRISNANHVYK